jgi:hypothetical protein
MGTGSLRLKENTSSTTARGVRDTSPKITRGGTTSRGGGFHEVPVVAPRPSIVHRVLYQPLPTRRGTGGAMTRNEVPEYPEFTAGRSPMWLYSCSVLRRSLDERRTLSGRFVPKAVVFGSYDLRHYVVCGKLQRTFRLQPACPKTRLSRWRLSDHRDRCEL